MTGFKGLTILGNLSSGISSKIDIVVAAEATWSKLKKVRHLEITVIDEEHWLDPSFANLVVTNG
ncbi:MAG: hypothetical protein OXE94_13480 [Aestuariivita sp.]|nr:hypothetical protein [Aestuariivita sp.]MCY4203972.1 hypothetical protein [Aestuariivita sp.]MCY4289213.1 hypothetical protein [Aestuariivita sp.]MCY4346879.1 hypothetical protein [Aestuariivita sp.]